MEQNISKFDRFLSGAYVVDGNAEPYIPFLEAESVILTQLGNTKLKDTIISIIEGAETVLKLCSFIITDAEIFQVILNKARATNVAVFILTQLDQTKLSNRSALNDHLTDEELKEDPASTHLKHVKTLYESGVHVRASSTAHAKFIVADRAKAFITSANFTTPSLTLNTESGVFLESKESFDLDKLFDVIFQSGASYRQFITSTKKNKVFVVQAEAKVNDRNLPPFSDSKLRYTYEDVADNLYREIVSIIDEADEYVYMSTYSAVSLDALPELILAMGRAHERGVKLFIFCRGMNYRNDHLVGSQLFSTVGCKISGNMYNHSKGIVSERKAMIFTANFDGKHGLKNGFEVGCILTDRQRVEFLELHRYLIRCAHYSFETNPIRADVFDTYTSYESSRGMKPPVFPENLTISIPRNIENLSPLFDYPIFYGRSSGSEFFVAGDSYYRCKSNGSDFQLLGNASTSFNLEKYILKYVNLKIAIEK